MEIAKEFRFNRYYAFVLYIIGLFVVGITTYYESVLFLILFAVLYPLIGSLFWTDLIIYRNEIKVIPFISRILKRPKPFSIKFKNIVLLRRSLSPAVNFPDFLFLKVKENNSTKIRDYAIPLTFVNMPYKDRVELFKLLISKVPKGCKLINFPKEWIQE